MSQLATKVCRSHHALQKSPKVVVQQVVLLDTKHMTKCRTTAHYHDNIVKILEFDQSPGVLCELGPKSLRESCSVAYRGHKQVTESICRFAEVSQKRIVNKS